MVTVAMPPNWSLHMLAYILANHSRLNVQTFMKRVSVNMRRDYSVMIKQDLVAPNDTGIASISLLKSSNCHYDGT